MVKTVDVSTSQPRAAEQLFAEGYVEDVAEVKTPLGVVFTILPCSINNSSYHPMPIIRHIDDQSSQIHPG
jgi:hypothetical protein